MTAANNNVLVRRLQCFWSPSALSCRPSSEWVHHTQMFDRVCGLRVYNGRFGLNTLFIGRPHAEAVLFKHEPGRRLLRLCEGRMDASVLVEGSPAPDDSAGRETSLLLVCSTRGHEVPLAVSLRHGQLVQNWTASTCTTS